MLSNQKNLNLVGIDEFLRALQSLSVKKDDISGEPLQINYRNVAPYSTHQRHSTPTKYEDEEEDDDEEEVRSPSHKHWVIKTTKHHLQACHKKAKAMFRSRPGASLINSMFFNVLIKLLLSIISNFISFISFCLHFNLFNKIEIIICNVDQYGDMDWESEDEFAYCKYTVWAIRHNWRYQ